MSSNSIDPLHKESDNPGEKVRKATGDLDDTKKALISTIDTIIKEGKTDIDEKKGKQN